jgi:hypothetical protein
MLKIRLTSIQSSYLKGMRAHHSIPSRSRRDTPSLLNRTQASPRRERIATLSFARERAAAWVWVLARYIPKVRAIIPTEISHPLRDTRRKWRLFHKRVTAGASLETTLASVGWSLEHEPRP